MEKWIRFVFMFAALLILFISLAPLPAISQTTGSISGTVTEAVASNPLEDVMVYAYSSDAPEGALMRDITDLNGEYSISGLTAGEYIVRSNPSGQNYIGEYYDDTLYYDDAKTVTVTAGGDTAGIDFELATGGMISGTVVDENGAGIENIWIAAYYDCYGTYLTGALTDGSGDYTIMGLPAPSVYLKTINYPFSSISYIPEWYGDAEYCDDSTPVPVTIGATTENIDFQLDPAGSISGTVYESDGLTPVSDMPVGLFSDPCDKWPFIATLTNTSGAYSFNGLAPNNVYVKAFYDEIIFPDMTQVYLRQWFAGALSCEEAQAVPIIAGSDMAGIDFLLSDNVDTDGDGMPDEWELHYFGDISRDGSGDFDNDGVTDLQEYEAGTNANPLGNLAWDIPYSESDESDNDGSGSGGGCFISAVIGD